MGSGNTSPSRPPSPPPTASVRVAPACYVCVGETEAAAQDKRSIIEGTAREIDALVLLSEVLNYDFASKPIDEPFTDAELTEFSFQGFRDRVIRLSGKKNPTVRDFISTSGRGTIKEHPMFFLRQPEAGGRSDGGMVYRASLRWVRAGGFQHAGRV